MTAIPEIIEPESFEHHETSFADMIERLFHQFEANLPLTTITSVVRAAREQLRGSPPTALPELTERLAFARLTTLVETAAIPARGTAYSMAAVTARRGRLRS